MKTSWAQQTGETDEWYDCFTLYLYMGPKRTVAGAQRFAARLAQGAVRGQPSRWQRAARQHQWRERAAAFDAAAFDVEAYRKTLESQVASVAQREGGGASEWSDEERLRMVAELLGQVYGVLRHADLLTLSKEEARQLLPTLRLFFRDLLHFHQGEVARLLAGDEGREGVEMSADELVKFLKERGGMQLVLSDMQRVTNAPANEASWQPLRDVLAYLYPDESSARRIVAQAQLDSGRIHFSARAVNGWHAILTEAAHTGRLEQVIEAAWQEYAGNRELAKAVAHYHQVQVKPVAQENEAKGERDQEDGRDGRTREAG